MQQLSICEDYCLAALAEFSDANIDFVADEEDKYLLADSKVTEDKYKAAKDLLTKYFQEAKSHQRQLPSDRESDQIAGHLGLSDMGSIIESAPLPNRRGTIPLCSTKMLENDENQPVLVYDDDFLRRAGGSRSVGASTSKVTEQRKDSSLVHYLGGLNHKKIIMFHKDFSPYNAKLPLSACKVFLGYLGGHPVPHNAEKIILVAKQFALRMFGVGYGCQALRTPYYLSYAAQALAAGIEQVEELHPYGKRMFMRAKKVRMHGRALPPVDQEMPTQMHIVEVEDNADVKRPRKKMKLSSLSPPPFESDSG